MRKTKLVSDHYYHLYNRGVNRGRIFFRPENWSFFLQRWRRYCRPELTQVIAYCLMPTHYHFLVYLQTDQFARQVMHPFAVSYTKAINKEQKRVGPLCSRDPFKPNW